MNHYQTSLEEALSTLPALAHEKILATLNDKTQEITTGQWTTLLTWKSKNKKPQACGCLMMDGYFKDNPPVLRAQEDPWYPKEKIWHMEHKEFLVSYEIDWQDVLLGYYWKDDEEIDEDVRDIRRKLVGHVAEQFDIYCKYMFPHVFKWKTGVKVLNAAGRKDIIQMLERIIESNVLKAVV